MIQFEVGSVTDIVTVTGKGDVSSSPPVEMTTSRSVSMALFIFNKLILVVRTHCI